MPEPLNTADFSMSPTQTNSIEYPEFKEAGPGVQYDILGRIARWYESAGIAREKDKLDRKEYGYLYEGKADEEKTALDKLTLTRFSNGDLVGVIWVHSEGYIDDVKFRENIAKTLAQKENKKYSIQGDKYLYWIIIISDDPEPAIGYYKKPSDNIPPN